MIEIQKRIWCRKFVNNISGFEIKKSLAIEPTCNISGLYSGYIEKAVKTIIPSTASAKLDFRLVSHMNPKTQFKKLVSHSDQKVIMKMN